MPMNDDYISQEERIRMQYEQMLAEAAQQPYGDVDVDTESNLEQMQTLMQQSAGLPGYDYSELLSQGSNVQRSGTTGRYATSFDQLGGNFGGQPPSQYSPDQGQQPGPLSLQVGTGGAGAALTSMALKRAFGRATQPSQQDQLAGIASGVDMFGRGGVGRTFVTPQQMYNLGNVGNEMSLQNYGLGQPGDSPMSYDLSQGASNPQTAPTGGSKPTGAQLGAGVATGMLTSYLINRYTNAPSGAGEISGAAVGGATTGALAGGASGAAVGAIGGGVTGVAGYAASQIAAKHIFGAGKESGKDIAARQLYEQYHGKGVGRRAKAAGYEGREDALSQQYLWMTEEGRKARAEGSTDPRYQTPEWRPSEWQAWVGAMSDAGYKMKDVYDMTAYYASEKGSKERGNAKKAFRRGEDFYMNPANDPLLTQKPNKVSWYERHGKMDEYNQLMNQKKMEAGRRKQGLGLTGWTDENREQRWQQVQQQHEMTALPWQTEGFKEAYGKEYGSLPEYSVSAARQKYGPSKPAKLGWYIRHYGEGEGRKAYVSAKQAWNTGIPNTQTDPYLQIPKTASVGDRFARMGVTQTPENRKLWGAGGDPYANKSWGVAGNTGGEGGHDIYGWGITGNLFKPQTAAYMTGGAGRDPYANKGIRPGSWGITGNTGGEGGHDIYGWVDHEENV